MIEHLHFVECDSTQDHLKEQLKHQTPGRSLLVSCDYQRKGYGRNGRSWENHEGGLCFSLTILPHKAVSFTALEMSVLMAQFFEYEGIELKLKWPNDILSSKQKKCGGILVQSFQNHFIAGIGINLYGQHGEYGGVYSSSFNFNAKLWAREIAEHITANRIQETAHLIEAWKERCAHLNETVYITEGGRTEEGLFIDLGLNGEAIIQGPQGIKSLYNGTLRFVPPNH